MRYRYDFLILAIPVVFALAAPGGAPTTGTVRDWGAIGDGVADDTAAIQRCIDAAPEGGEVRLPVGRYRVTKPITIGKTLALIGEGAAYSQYLGPFGDPAYASPNYAWGAIIESTVTDGPTLDHSPGRYTGLRIEHLAIKGIGDGTRTGPGIRIAFPGGACEAELRGLQISNFAVGIDAQSTMCSTFDRIRVNGCDVGILLRSNGNTLSSLALSGCGDGVVLDGASKNTITGAIQSSTRVGVVLKGGSEENSLRDIYFENPTGQLAIDVQSSADATVIDSCHFGTPGDGVWIDANWCRVFAGKYVNGLTLNGIGTQLHGTWHGPISPLPASSTLVGDNARGVVSPNLTLAGDLHGATLDFGDGRRWGPEGLTMTSTLRWIGDDAGYLWPQFGGLHFQDAATGKLTTIVKMTRQPKGK
jgi:hypothetical protein